MFDFRRIGWVIKVQIEFRILVLTISSCLCSWSRSSFQLTVFFATIEQTLLLAMPDILSPSIVHLKHSGFSSCQQVNVLLASHFTPSVYSSMKESCQ